MNRRNLAIATAVAGVSIAASVGTALAQPTRPAVRSGAFSFVAVQLVDHGFRDSHAVAADREVSGGKVIGTDTLACVSLSRTSAKCQVAASYNGGQIFGVFTENLKTGTLAGRVTGGNRHFAGATGTISGTPISATKEKVSITYQTT